MARTARQFPQGKFTLRTPKQTKNGQMYAIYIYYYWQGRQVRRSADSHLRDSRYLSTLSITLGVAVCF